MAGRLVFSFGWLAAALLAVTALGCGSEKGSVELVWQAPEDQDIGLDAEALKQASVFKTLVYVRNETDETLRDASLRFQPNEARNLPAGMRIGTVTNISSRFQGEDQLWAVGDLSPGERVAVPLGLFFSLDVQASQSHAVELTVALVSPDLDEAIQSNPLKVTFRP